MANDNINKKNSFLKLPSIKGCNKFQTYILFTIINFMLVANKLVEIPDYIKEELNGLYGINLIVNIAFIVLIMASLFAINYGINNKKKNLLNTSVIMGAVIMVFYTIFKGINFYMVVKKLNLTGGISSESNYTEDAKKSLNYLFSVYTVFNIILILTLIIAILYIIQLINYDVEEDEKSLPQNLEVYFGYLKKDTIFGLILMCIVIVFESLLLISFMSIGLIISNACIDLSIICYIINIYLIISKNKYKDQCSALRSMIQCIVVDIILKCCISNSGYYYDDNDKKTTYTEFINDFNKVQNIFSYKKFLFSLLALIVCFYLAYNLVHVMATEKLIQKADQENGIIVPESKNKDNKNEQINITIQ